MQSYFPVTDQMIWHEPLLAAMLGALKTVPGGALLTTPCIRLYTNDRTPDTNSEDPAGFDEPTFTGYDEKAVTFSSAVNIGSTGKGLVGTVVFACTTTGAAENIKGWFLTDGAGGAATKVYAEGNFDGLAMAIGEAGDAISLTVILPLQAYQAVSS